ncbi:SpvB/TcaC N-terminal domain-containing protein [Flavobacterium sp. NKUCC04_CG]|uniref:SpvB/TcaC N-terminal domain-containing protein n=1 Tax=Flavobacterium sp. NKUCC04_CG TaxID=2842121 RepID=UPI001C5BE2BD|nr:SpvB/TcaC N-terminal domain-containing protein [Flavobacterium sp. NKUCC04_CG]MBW3520171.1 hypothetical protein [Flavobacterium sp. NKUCC04_CG]
MHSNKKSKKNTTATWVLLVAMFHSIFLQPLFAMGNQHYFPYRDHVALIHQLAWDFKSATLEQQEVNPAVVNATSSPNANTAVASTIKELTYKEPTLITSYVSDLDMGVIGYDAQNRIDDPSDNLFRIDLGKNWNSNLDYELVYDLYGLESSASVSRSINARVASGGILIKKNNSWSTQRESLNSGWLHSGINTVLFTVPSTALLQYRVKNVRIEAKKNVKNAHIVVENEGSSLSTDNQIYIKGFVSNQSKNWTFQAEGQDLLVRAGEFEGLVTLKTMLQEQIVLEAFENGILKERKTVAIRELISADQKSDLGKIAAANAVMTSSTETAFLSVDEASVSLPALAMKTPTQIIIQPLRDIDVAPSGVALINVTRNHKGFRMLPDGTQFEKPVRIEIPYDKTAIPSGYTDRDVQVFFFDTALKNWQKVTVDSLDIALQRIAVQTNHFTDYIAGIIQAPESPETTSFSPTSISSMQPPNFATNIVQIEAPSANDQGDASLTYPLTIPAARNGMQPDLNIRYNSGGGSGWMGLGWDISVPSIEIDTRWGVPAFDPNKETESYMLNGEELMLETSPGNYYMPHKNPHISRVSNAVFRPRVEGAFQQITRVGNSPSNYSWIIKSKDGKIYTYGSNSTNRLASDSGQIVRWMLEKVEDFDKNEIKYQYTLKTFTTGILAGGKQLYLTSIDYGHLHAKYSVGFNRKTTTNTPLTERKDKTFSTRFGFKEVTADLLAGIRVVGKTPTFAEVIYDFKYKVGAFDKTLLQSITTTNSSNNNEYYNGSDWADVVPLVHEHQFDYYNDIAGGGLFEGNAVSIYSNHDYNGFYENFGVKLSALGGTEGNNKTFGGGGSAGVVVPAIPTSYLPWSNSASIAGNLSGSWSRSETMVSLLDIDGDGLPDKVVKMGGKMYYRKNLGGGFAQELGLIKGISNLSFSKTDGSDLGFSINPFIGNYAKTKSKSNSSVYTYIEDVNADGLPDVVDNTRVYFNHLDPNTKLPVFTLDSSQTPNIVIKEGDVAPVLNAMPALDIADGLMDIVKVWRAPRDGVINIRGQITKEHVAIDNGIRYSVEKGAGDFSGETAYLRQPQLMVQGSEPTNFNNIAVNRGDLIFFRVSSSQIPEAEVQVSWSPAITYVANDKISANKYPLYSSTYNDAFIVGASQEFTVMKNGTYKLEWDSFAINNLGGTNATLSDDVTFRVTYYKRDQNSGAMLPLRNNNVEIYKVIAKNNANTSINSPNLTLNVAGVSESSPFSFQYIKVEVLADSEVNWKHIDTLFKPRLIIDGITNHLIPYYTNYGYVHSNYEHLTYTSDVHRVYLKHYFVIPNCSDNTCLKRYVYLTIKENDHLLFVEGKPMKFRYTMNGNGTTEERRRYNATTGNYDEVLGDYTSFVVNTALWRKLHVEYFASDSGIGELFEKSQRNLQLVTLSAGTGDTGTGFGASKYWANVYSQDLASGFGPMYRHWGQFAYKGPEPNQNFEKIDLNAVNVKRTLEHNNPQTNTSTEDMLTNTTPNHNQVESNIDFIEEMGGNISSEFSILMPNKERKVWQTHDKLYVSETRISPNKRFLDDDIPVPRAPTSPVLNYGAYGIIKQTHSKTSSVNKSIGYLMFTIGQSTNQSESRVLNDFRDINGDGYPDIIGAKIQMTTPKGGLSSTNILNANILPNSTQTGSGVLAGGGKSSVSTAFTPTGEVCTPNIAVGGSASGGANGSVFTTKNDVDKIVVDVNGDGLPDVILNDGSLLLNIGNQFVPQTGWSFPSTNKSTTATTQAGVGGGDGIERTAGKSLSNLDLSLGLSISSSTSKELDTYIDINGDGLPDRIVDGTTAYLNTGTGFGQAFTLPNSPTQTSSVGGINASVTVCISFPILFGFGPKFCISLMGSVGKTMTQESVRYMDFDGDGYPDLLTSTDDHQLKVQYSRIKRTNLLKSVKRPLGSTVTMNYATKNPISNTPIGGTYKMPFKKWALTSITVDDGFRGDGEDVMKMAFEYHNGYKDRRERKFLGFGLVKSHQLKANGDLYRTQITEYVNNSLSDNHLYQSGISSDLRQYFYKKGLVNKETTLNAQGRAFKEVQYQYSYFQAQPEASASYNTQGSVSFNYTDTSRIVPLLRAITTMKINFVEGNSYSLNSYVSFPKYDGYGNVTQYIDNTKGLTTDISYHNVGGLYLKTVPQRQDIYGGGISRRFETSIADGKHITQIRKYIDNSPFGRFAQYDMEYGSEYGELRKVTLPKADEHNDESSRMYYKYDYYAYLQNGVEVEHSYSYPQVITDAFGLVSKTVYNTFGIPMKTVDANGNEFLYHYDVLNRLILFKGPYSPEWTIKNTFERTLTGQFYTLTQQNLENENGISNGVLQSTSFIDGLGRVVQSKKLLEGDLRTDDCLDPGTRLWVSGKTVYDEFGRVISQYLPVEEKECGGVPVVSLLEYSNLDQPDTEKTSMYYDVQDRMIRQHVYATNATTSMKYGYERDSQERPLFTEEVTLPEGNKTVTYIDENGRTAASKQIGHSNDLWTTMKYDPLGQLLNLTDAENHTTTYEYDTFGQKTQVEHPDSGITQSQYYLTGQLATVTTANGDQIQYKYDMNRLYGIYYPSHEVTYEYGDVGIDDGRKGRITMVYDQTGQQEFQYGKLGEVIESKRLIKDFGGTQRYFKTMFIYDSWGKLLNLTYPDQEKVIYQYNSVGQLKSITSDDGQSYLRDVRYTFFGEPEKIVYGNGVVTTQEYDVAQRMRAMQLTRPDDSVVQRNVYSFNKNNQVERVKSRYAQTGPRAVGGMFNKDYQYDEFNRLMSSKGDWKGQDIGHGYSLNMTYNKTHGIKSKIQKHSVHNYITDEVTETVNSGWQEYEYQDSQHAHAVNSIAKYDYDRNQYLGTKNFSYDKNGNTIQILSDIDTDLSRDRTMIWDEQNRLLEVNDNNQIISKYKYDAVGERVLKLVETNSSGGVNGNPIFDQPESQGETIYPSGYLVMGNSEYTKHYYANNKRIASRIGQNTDQDYFKNDNGWYAQRTASTVARNASGTAPAARLLNNVDDNNYQSSCEAQVNQLLNTFYNTPSRQHCRNKILEIIQAHTRLVQGPSGQVINVVDYCIVLREINRLPCVEIDPNTGWYIDPDTGYLINPDTGYLLDPATGWYMDPNTGLLVDPNTTPQPTIRQETDCYTLIMQYLDYLLVINDPKYMEVLKYYKEYTETLTNCEIYDILDIPPVIVEPPVSPPLPEPPLVDEDPIDDEWEDDAPDEGTPSEIFDEALRKPIWWYHGDHLGSSSYITDNFGKPTHYYEYLPFGELMVEQNQSTYYNNGYKFNAKELDAATGMYYYGARYYDPSTSIFLSVDPLAEMMPNYSPYVYTFNNPINFTDPTGMIGEEVIITGEKKQEAFNQLQSSTKLSLTIDDSGKVSATGKASSKSDKLLKEAIDSKSVQVNVNATSSNYLDNGETPLVIGAYEGSTINDSGKTIASQVVNPIQTAIADKFYEAESGTYMKHEVMEGYLGGKNFPGKSINQGLLYDKNSTELKAYLDSHNKAMGLDRGFVQPTVEEFTSKGLYLMKPHPNPNFKIPQAQLINDKSR